MYHSWYKQCIGNSKSLFVLSDFVREPFNNYTTLKLPFFDPPTPHHDDSSWMIHDLFYVTSRLTQLPPPLYHLFLFFEVKKKIKTRTHPWCIHPFFEVTKPNCQIWIENNDNRVRKSEIVANTKWSQKLYDHWYKWTYY